MEILVERVMGKVCDAAASAAYRYAELSGENPLECMPAMVANAVANTDISATLEVNLGRLRKWDNNGRTRLGLLPSVSPTPVDELMLLSDAKRPDLVLFAGDPLLPKSEQIFLAIVEFKLGRIALREKQKIHAMLKEMTTCPYGAICSLVYGRPEDHPVDKDRWVYRTLPPMAHGIEHTYSICLSFFPRSP